MLFLLPVVKTNASTRVMTFNTTCSKLCEKGNYDKFKYRKHWIVDTIKRNNPDLVALQEVLLSRQLKWIKKKLKDYHLIYYRKFYIFRFADPALLIKKQKYEISKNGGFWLGPRGYRFSFGWKRALPRRVHWAKLRDIEQDQEFYFVSSHFDNRKKNKERSAEVLTNAFKNVELPIIFAADTNLRPEMDGFKHLLTQFEDSFELKENFEMIRNSDTTIHDSCNLEKATIFPACRVDHILLSKRHRWKVSNWGVDQFKYGKKERFTSDHRAIFADLEFQ
jgi:endonuclease/exonuclease/phosphatase family metal-dependent hydrolase